MSADIVFVFSLIGIVAALMASNRVRFDVVALLVLLALMLSGILTPRGREDTTSQILDYCV